MSDELTSAVREVCRAHGDDRTRMMDIVRAVQARFGCVPGSAMDAIARATAAHRVEVEGVISFHSFLSTRAKGKVIIRLCNDIIDRMNGVDRVATAFSSSLGIGFG
ncbi:MAG: NAD(P)H-dependent oxidoreductase subunit E, partial [Planctomycetes bacterium]|nr:NAD(P)H-dependent oxidoreductase subunit E [Planctomycetota bacterium]